jgi:hypothetical protein
MKDMKRFLTVLAALLALAVTVPGFTPPPAQAQGVLDVSRFLPATPVANALGADNSDIAFYIKYTGTSGNATVAVTGNNTITLLDGGAADVTLECPVSGALGGIIDATNGSCNTLGKVVDAINSSTTGAWRAVIVDGLRSDSTNGSLFNVGATQATVADGIAIKWNTATVGFKSTIALVPTKFRNSIQPWLGTRAGIVQAPQLMSNPFAGTMTRLLIANATSTYGSGTSNYEVHSVRVLNKAVAGSGTAIPTQGTEVDTLLYSTPGGATTANKVYDFTQFGIIGNPDEKLLVRLNNSAAMASTVHYAYGQMFKY